MRNYPIILKYQVLAYGVYSHVFIENEQDYHEWISINANSCWVDSEKRAPWTHFRDQYNNVERSILNMMEYLLSDLDLWGTDTDKFYEFLYENVDKPQATYNFSTTAITVFSKNSPKPSHCHHPKRYKNSISKSLCFWVCPDCKADLGNA